MNNDVLTPNIIRASAGTGKTYRLSLEYISLLLKLKDQLEFDEILVITFTKKATDEIRQRIIEFLHILAENGKKAPEIKGNILKIYPDIDFSTENIQYLTSVYQKIISNKSRLNISTLDSFINSIFKSLIAPYHNINRYTIDPLINDSILPEIYQTILQDEHFPLVQNIFKLKRSRNISAYDEFIKAILDNRWLFEFYDKSQIQNVDFKSMSDQYYDAVVITAREFSQRFADILKTNYPDLPWTKIFPRDWLKAIDHNNILDNTLKEGIEEILISLFKDREFLRTQYSLINNSGNIWNGSSLFRKKAEAEDKELMLDLQAKLLLIWKHFLYYERVLPEHQDILDLSKVIFRKYDQIKFRDKILTYNDLATYTWKYLHDPAISIIDTGEVLNLFYEQLSYRIRFILIDEFQDTSILQWNIFAPLIREIIAGYGATDAGSFTIVGDEKQAIYAWRSGERELLVNMENLLPAQFRHSDLKTSFRSSLAVIHFVNRLFTDQYFLDNIKSADLNWEYSHIETEKDEPGYCYLQITNLYGNPDNIEFSQVIANFIRNIYLPACNSGEISPSDTAILTRTHNEMNTVAAVLRELEIDYIDETNLSILKQRAIKPIMALLNWFYNLDFYNLITFLRSDAVLLNSQSLKDILEFWQTCQKLELPFCPDLYDKFARIPQIAILGALHKHLSDPLILAKAIITDFNLIKIFDQEIDFANITKFLNLIAEFLAVNLDYSHDLGGLLRYFADNENAEYFNQTGIQHQNVLKILTIHKSKGLEFDTVIMMQKNSSSTGRLPELSIYPEYTSDFSGLSSCLFTYNFTSLIKDSPADPLSELQRKREDVEAINVWYVALTRAKRNLFALIAYSMKDGLEKYYSSFDDAKPDINKLICGSLAAEFVTESLQVDNSLIIKMGELSKYNTRHDDDALILSGLSDISAWFSATPSELFTARDDWQIQIPPADYHLLARAKVLGNIAHYYLEQIRFDSQAARKQAADRTLAFYGSLIPASDILTIITKVDAIITENFPLFDPANWDQCYCEWSVFDNNKNEYRIDRLLISHSRKQVQVIDYKTGEITAEDQIRKYNELLKKIPFFAKNHYDILEGVFLKIKL